MLPRDQLVRCQGNPDDKKGSKRQRAPKHGVGDPRPEDEGTFKRGATAFPQRRLWIKGGHERGHPGFEHGPPPDARGWAGSAPNRASKHGRTLSDGRANSSNDPLICVLKKS